MNNDIKDPGRIHPSSLPPLTCWLTVFRLLASRWCCDGCYSSRHYTFTPPDLRQHRGVRTSSVAQMVKRLSTMRETGVQALGWEDPLEKEMAIHYSILAWKIPWTGDPGGL